MMKKIACLGAMIAACAAYAVDLPAGYVELEYIRANGIDDFYITGADATACVKSTCFNMKKAGYAVHVISDCVTSYDLKKMDEMLAYYADKGCEVRTLAEYRSAAASGV